MFKISFTTPLAARACVAALVLGLAGMAAAATPLSHRSATMQCADRRITVEADCFAFTPGTTMCTRQSIRFAGPDGKALGERAFKSMPLKNADYPVVPEQIGELTCVETPDKKTFLVALMDTGGNCEDCEWNDVYSADGALVGSTRNGKEPGAAAASAIDAAYDARKKHVLGHQALTPFYRLGGAR